jgi:hypothetical protein
MEGISSPAEGCPMLVRHFLAMVMVIACVNASAAQQQPAAVRVKVEVHLAAEHVPETIKANSRADLVYVQSSVKSRNGKILYNTRRVAADVEVVSVKREKKPADPARAVLVELRVTKEQAAKIEKMKTRVVTVVEREDGKSVTKKQPVTLRLEPAPPTKQ